MPTKKKGPKQPRYGLGMKPVSRTVQPKYRKALEKAGKKGQKTGAKIMKRNIPLAKKIEKLHKTYLRQVELLKRAAKRKK